MAGSPPKYALIELERRFRVDPARLPDLTGAPCRRIEDLYVRDSRLRLRRMTDLADGAVVWKLCRKYPTDDPLGGWITNLYLDAAEYDLLSGLPGDRLSKRRSILAGPAGERFALDRFEGPLTGLILGEAEFSDRAAAAALTPPPWVAFEVTGDPSYAGAALARMSKIEAAVLAGQR